MSRSAIDCIFQTVAVLVKVKDLIFSNYAPEMRQKIVDNFGDIHEKLCKTLEIIVDLLFPEKLFQLIIRYNILESLFTIR